MKKHVYLIMAHDNFDMLSLLLKELDDIRNDIVIHIDKKSSNVNIADLKNIVSIRKFLLLKVFL